MSVCGPFITRSVVTDSGSIPTTPGSQTEKHIRLEQKATTLGRAKEEGPALFAPETTWRHDSLFLFYCPS